MVMMYAECWEKFGNFLKWMHYYSIISAILHEWKESLNFDLVCAEYTAKYDILDSLPSVSSTIYTGYIRDTKALDFVIERWNEILQIDIDYDRL